MCFWFWNVCLWGRSATVRIRIRSHQCANTKRKLIENERMDLVCQHNRQRQGRKWIQWLEIIIVLDVVRHAPNVGSRNHWIVLATTETLCILSLWNSVHNFRNSLDKIWTNERLCIIVFWVSWRHSLSITCSHTITSKSVFIPLAYAIGSGGVHFHSKRNQFEVVLSFSRFFFEF